jgi:ankyrin repeat protein
MSLRAAVIASDVALAKQYPYEDPSSPSPEDLGHTCYHLAAQYNDSVMMSFLVSLRSTHHWTQVKNHRGNTVWHLCAACSSAGVLKYLLGVDKRGLNMVNGWGETPLHLAYASGSQECIDLLIHAGADTGALDRWERTPQQCGLEHGFGKVSAMTGSMLPGSKVLSKCLEAPLDEQHFITHTLHRTDLDLWGKDMYTLTAMHKLAAWNKDLALKALLDRSTTRSQWCPVDKDGNTPLHHAAMMGATRAFEVLKCVYTEDETRLKNEEGRQADQYL